MSQFLSIPKSGTYCLTNFAATSPIINQDILDAREIYVDSGTITEQHDGPVIDCKGSIIFPTFVDMHTHLDKGHIWPRAANQDGTFDSALATVHQDREANWEASDVRRRMNFALNCAYIHGTKSIRTHLDSLPPQHEISWPVFNEVRLEWKNKIELQAVSLFGADLIDDSEAFFEVANLTAKYGGILGCVTYPMKNLENHLDNFFNTAAERSMNVDFHVDETRDPNSATLRLIAESALRTKYEGTIVVGHCCSLSRQSDDLVQETLDRVVEAKINVVSLPMCNMYLQDRFSMRTPRWRGVTLVHEMQNRGIDVSFASDNTRDPFYAYGDLDMIEVMREATRICHLDHSNFNWYDAFLSCPSSVCNFSKADIFVDNDADFVICRARNWSELMSRPQSDRIVVRKGHPIERELPNYSELDDLMVK